MAALEEAPAAPAPAPAPTAASPTVPAGKKPYFGLGTYLPKVSNYRKKDTPPQDNDDDHDQHEEAQDEHRELPELAATAGNGSDAASNNSVDVRPASESSAAKPSWRMRGISMEQNPFNSLRRMSFRNSNASLSSQNSLSDTDNGSPSDSPRETVPSRLRRGACVSTKFGTGTLLDLRQDDGFYVVQLVPKTIAYLREEQIIREIKSVVGERVKTRWGLATVEQYYVEEDMYSIALDWRWDDDHVWRMKATTKKFEKLHSRGSIMQNMQFTKNKLFEGYSSIRESTSSGYATVVAKLNTTTTASSGTSPPSTAATTASPPPAKRPQQSQSLGKAVTPYGICTVIEVRPDQFFVVQTTCGATAYLHADSVKLLQRRTHFAPGDRVKTIFGRGEIVDYREQDEIYEIRLDANAAHETSTPATLFMSDHHAESMLSYGSSSYNNRLSSIFTLTRNSVYSASATVKASATGGLTNVCASATGGLTTVKAKMSTIAAYKTVPKARYQKDERVLTPFGSGFVVDVRPADKIYQVYLRRLKFSGYFHESAISEFPYERVTHFIVDGKTVPAPEMPKHSTDVKRRAIITAAMKAAQQSLVVPGGIRNASMSS